MRFGIFAARGAPCWAAARLQDEGHEVFVWVAPPKDNPTADRPDKHIGDGIFPKANNWSEFVAWCKKGKTVAISDGIGDGERGNILRRAGIPVIGGSPFCDRLEHDREHAIRVAQECGISVPEFYSFGSVSAAMAWLEHRTDDEEWFFKSDRDLGTSLTTGGSKDLLLLKLFHVREKFGDRIKHILQKKINGVAISTAGWWNGRTFLEPFEGTIEHKEAYNGDLGPKTGCILNIVWYYERPKIVEELHFHDTLTTYFRQQDAPPGIYDINAVVSIDDGKAYFLEFTPRFGYDSEPTATRLLENDYGEFLAALGSGILGESPFVTDEAAMALRLYLPPYPSEVDIPRDKSYFGVPLPGLDGLWAERRSDRFMAYGVMKNGQDYALADPGGMVGLSSALGTDLRAMNKACVEYATGTHIGDLGLRTDADQVLRKDIDGVRRAGYEVPLGL